MRQPKHSRLGTVLGLLASVLLIALAFLVYQISIRNQAAINTHPLSSATPRPTIVTQKSKDLLWIMDYIERNHDDEFDKYCAEYQTDWPASRATSVTWGYENGVATITEDLALQTSYGMVNFHQFRDTVILTENEDLDPNSREFQLALAEAYNLTKNPMLRLTFNIEVDGDALIAYNFQCAPYIKP